MDLGPRTPELALLLDPDLPHGTAGHALLEATVAQGFSRPVARAGLRAELDAWRMADLRGLMAEADLARRPSTVLVLAPRTLPASAMRQVFLARALGAEVMLKTAAGQDALGEALAAADPAIVPSPFDSQDPQALERLVPRADTVVVLGSDETVAAVRPRVPPTKGFAGHGHKVSAHWLPDLRGVDLGVLADAIARDLLAWDQAGCLSPQVVWAGPDAKVRADLLHHLADAVSRLESEFPLSEPSRPPAAAARRHMTTLATMLGEPSVVTATATLAMHPEPTFRAAPGPRALWLLPASAEAAGAVVPHLSTLATLPSGERLPGSFAGALALRTCRPGEMQQPPLTWHQDGLHPIASLLRP